VITYKEKLERMIRMNVSEVEVNLNEQKLAEVAIGYV
jgi:hypothetical protein